MGLKGSPDFFFRILVKKLVPEFSAENLWEIREKKQNLFRF